MYESALSRAEDRAPLAWVTQLRTIADQNADPGSNSATTVQRTAVAHLWRHLPRLAGECARPSAWPDHRAVESIPEATGGDPKVLGKIRGLLAKAESTEYAEEAETFTAKAQELMTKYAVTAALLGARGEGGTRTIVRSSRIHLENPYVKEKALLLSEIGNANRVRTVWFNKLAMATCVGTPIDLEQSELLFTSLLVQATRAMQEASLRAKSIDPEGSPTSFRRAFLYGFAIRIGQRLKLAGQAVIAQAAAGADVSVRDALPVLADQAAAVDAAFDRMFPATKATRSSKIDESGYFAGRSAADRASLHNDGFSGRVANAG